MKKNNRFVVFVVLVLYWWLSAYNVAAQESKNAPSSVAYILGDSIAYGLHLDGFEAKFSKIFGGTVKISYDGDRSITTAGAQIKQSGLDSVLADKDFIAKADTIVVILGMNVYEASFVDSQRQLLESLRLYAPKARYFWVDIAATTSTHAEIWSGRNKLIYDNAKKLDYSVISRYKAIFGPTANPLKITPGINFPGWESEPGLGGPGNIHGYYAELGQEILYAISPSAAVAAQLVKPTRVPCKPATLSNIYVLGDSVAFGLLKERLGPKLSTEFGSVTRFNFDSGRSILTPGTQTRKSALEAVEKDRDFIAKSDAIILSLGTNQLEESFTEAQATLLSQLRGIAPKAKYYWIDIGATMSNQAVGWSLRNKTIYQKAAELGYSVISRYRSIFGSDADPMNITPGLNFPDMEDEPGFGGKGNIHGAYKPLAETILDTIAVDYGCLKAAAVTTNTASPTPVKTTTK